jgi:hypothetical protein
MVSVARFDVAPHLSVTSNVTVPEQLEQLGALKFTLRCELVEQEVLETPPPDPTTWQLAELSGSSSVRPNVV